MRRHCISCRKLIDAGSYCTECEHHRLAAKPRSPSSDVTSRAPHKSLRRAIEASGPPWRCRICGDLIHTAADLHLDHIWPVSRGGHNGPLAPSHRLCNLRKGNHPDHPRNGPDRPKPA